MLSRRDFWSRTTSTTTQKNVTVLTSRLLFFFKFFSKICFHVPSGLVPADGLFQWSSGLLPALQAGRDHGHVPGGGKGGGERVTRQGCQPWPKCLFAFRNRKRKPKVVRIKMGTLSKVLGLLRSVFAKGGGKVLFFFSSNTLPTAWQPCLCRLTK